MLTKSLKLAAVAVVGCLTLAVAIGALDGVLSALNGEGKGPTPQNAQKRLDSTTGSVFELKDKIARAREINVELQGQSDGLALQLDVLVRLLALDPQTLDGAEAIAVECRVDTVVCDLEGLVNLSPVDGKGRPVAGIAVDCDAALVWCDDEGM